MKKDFTLRKVMETQKDLKNTEGFDWLESTELAQVPIEQTQIPVEQTVCQTTSSGRARKLKQSQKALNKEGLLS